MLDTKTKLVLKVLCQECDGGGYKIIETADIISALPVKYRQDAEGIKHTLVYLERQDMISIKYDDDGVFCLSVLPYGRESAETEMVTNMPQKTSKKRHFLLFFCVFLTVFLANFLAIYVFFLIFK